MSAAGQGASVGRGTAWKPQSSPGSVAVQFVVWTLASSKLWLCYSRCFLNFLYHGDVLVYIDYFTRNDFRQHLNDIITITVYGMEMCMHMHLRVYVSICPPTHPSIHPADSIHHPSVRPSVRVSVWHYPPPSLQCSPYSAISPSAWPFPVPLGPTLSPRREELVDSVAADVCCPCGCSSPARVSGVLLSSFFTPF